MRLGVWGVKTKDINLQFSEEKNYFLVCGCKAAAAVICV
jgi:hypothetical protein